MPKNTPSSPISAGSIAVLLITDPSGARFPTGKHTVDVSPARPRPIRRKDHLVRIDSIALLQILLQRPPPLALLPPVQALAQRLARSPSSPAYPAAPPPADAASPPARRPPETPAPSQNSAAHSAAHPPAAAPRDSRASSPPPSAAAVPPHAQSPEYAAANSSTPQTPHAPPSHSANAASRQNVPRPNAQLPQPQQRRRRPLRRIQPDRLPRRSQRRVRQRQPQRLRHHLRRRRRPQKLAAAARRRARTAAHLRRVLQRNLSLRKARPNRLDLPRILAALRQQRHPARHQHRRQRPDDASAIIIAGSPLSHVATPSTPVPRRQRPHQPPQHHRRIVPVGQRIQHPRRALRPPVARIGARPGKRHRPPRLQLARRLRHQQPHLPVSGVEPQRNRRSRLPRATRHACSESTTPARPSAPDPNPSPHSASAQTNCPRAASAASPPSAAAIPMARAHASPPRRGPAPSTPEPHSRQWISS